MKRTIFFIGRPLPNLDHLPPELADGQWGPSPSLQTANADIRRASVSTVRHRATVAVRGPVRRPAPIAF
jgi:hypothetical protein